MGLAIALGPRHVGAGGRNPKRCAMGVLGAVARAVDRHSRRLFLQGAFFVCGRLRGRRECLTRSEKRGG